MKIAGHTDKPQAIQGANWVRILFLGLFVWAVIIGTAMTACSAWADSLDNIAIYGVDRIECKLIVPQAYIDNEVYQAMKEYNVSAAEVLDTAARKVIAMQEYMKTKTYAEVSNYCLARQR